MKTYVHRLQDMYNPQTYKRKLNYIQYNFSKYIDKFNKKDISVLEIGPGLGEFVYHLNQRGIACIDVLDNDKAVLKYIKSNYKIRNSILTGDIEGVQNKLGQYSIIFLLQVLEHIPKRRYKTYIKILFKHLCPQGYLIITVPNGGTPLGLSERYNDLQHETLFTEHSLRELANYSEILNYDIEIKGYMIPPFNLINIVRIIFQKVYHLFLSILYIINAGVYIKIHNPNISLIIKKNK